MNVVNINVPPLRDRIEDIPLLVDFFIAKYCAAMNRTKMTIEANALSRLQKQDFPGNIRELENMIERAIVVGNGKKITVKNLPIQTDIISSSGTESLDEISKLHIMRVLNHHDWNISRAAKALKVDRVTLYSKIKKYNLKQEK